MINCTFPATADAAISYYGHVGSELERVLDWDGDDARRLGLSGRVDLSDWRNLVRGMSPDGEKLAQRLRDDRRPLLDITISTNKPTSVLRALVDDDIRTVIEDANRGMMDLAQGFMQTRVKGLLGQELVTTGSMISAGFYHDISRAREPNDHIHNTVLALTHHKGKWYAPEFDHLVKHSELLKAVFHNDIAVGLQHRGFETYATKDNFGVKGVPASVCRKLSTGQDNIDTEQARLGDSLQVRIERAQATRDVGVLRKEAVSGMERELKSLDGKKRLGKKQVKRQELLKEKIGEVNQVKDVSSLRTLALAELEREVHFLKSPKARAALAVLVRDDKRKDLDAGELKQEWWGRLTAAERQALDTVQEEAAARRNSSWADRSAYHLDRALAGLLRDESAIPEERLLTEALKQGIGEVSLAGLRSAIQSGPYIRAEDKGTRYVTTMDALLKEQDVLRKAEKGHIRMRRLKRNEEPKPQSGETVLKSPSFEQLHEASQTHERLLVVYPYLLDKNAMRGDPNRWLAELGKLAHGQPRPKPLLVEKAIKVGGQVAAKVKQHLKHMHRVGTFRHLQEYNGDGERARKTFERVERDQRGYER